MDEHKKLTFGPIIREKDRLLKYLESIMSVGGKPNMSSHRRLLKQHYKEARFCEVFLQTYQISAFSLYRLITENFEGFHLYCVVCGSKLKERNLMSRYSTCSHECGSVNCSTKVSMTRSKAKDALQKTRDENFAKYKEEQHLTDELDTNMTDIRENVEILSDYLFKISDAAGNPNSSQHYKYLRENDPAAILADCILTEYAISLGELNYILKNNFENVTFFCKTCGKRIKDVARSFCSVACEMHNEELAEHRRQTSLERYGATHFAKSEIGKAKIRERMIQKYGDLPVRTEAVKKKTQQTCLERYGTTSSWRNPEVVEKITKSRRRTNRIKLYPLFLEYLKKHNLQLLSTEEEYMEEKTLKIKCIECGDVFEAKNSPYIQYLAFRIICEKCHEASSSNGEDEIYFFIKNLLPDAKIIRHARKVLDNQFELDIYLPEYNFAIEYDGIYWHSSNRCATSKTYHADKTKLCKERGIKLIHVFENEWMYYPEIVKSIIKSRLGIYEKKIYARRCKVVNGISDQAYHQFLATNHIQGYSPASTRVGLYYNDELVACIGIGGSRFKPGEIELIRYCTKMDLLIVGGLSKLIKHSGVKDFISYTDLRYFDGSGYEKAGFEFLNQTSPGYVYIKDGEILSRYQCQKHKLSKLLGDNFHPELTEVENMTLAGYYQLYDCGMLKFRYKATDKTKTLLIPFNE